MLNNIDTLKINFQMLFSISMPEGIIFQVNNIILQASCKKLCMLSMSDAFHGNLKYIITDLN